MIYSSNAIFRYVSAIFNLINEDTNPFALSYSDQTNCTSLQFLCAPITIPICCALFTAFAVYEISEVYHSKQRSIEKKADIPLIDFLSGFLESNVARAIQSYVQDNQFGTASAEIYQMIDSLLASGRSEHEVALFMLPIIKTSSSSTLFYNFILTAINKIIGYHGTYQIGSNGFQMLLNSQHIVRKVYGFLQKNNTELQLSYATHPIQSSRAPLEVCKIMLRL